MKLGLLTQWYAPEPGGGVVPGVLANGLVDRGHDVRVLTGFPNYPSGRVYDGYRQRWHHHEEPRDGLGVRRVPLYPSHGSNPVGRAVNYLSFGASAAAQSGAYLADRDALWVYNSPAPVGSVARRLAGRRGVPFLLHVMDVWPDSVTDSGMLSSGAIHRIADASLARIVARTYDTASLIAVTSPGQQELLHSRGVPLEKLRYVPVWADESVFHPREPQRSLLPPDAQGAELVIMYAGAMGHVQRLDDAIRAVAATRRDVHLVMVGSGMAEQSLRDLVRDLDTRRVHFMGSRPSGEMGELGCAADVHLVSLADTPLMRVTMPSKVQSIMAQGRPIIASCAGDAAETVLAAGAGVAVSPGNVGELTHTLDAVAQNPADLARWGTSARTYYEGVFARANAVDRVESLLAEVAR